MKRLAVLSAVVALAVLPGGASLGQPAAPAAPAGQVAPAATPVPTFTQPSGANLNISPKRVTLDRVHRTGQVYVFNQGSGPGTFDISLVDRVMLPDGQILAVSDAQADPDKRAVANRVQSAQGVLQIAPRRITLNPGQGQTIRLRLAALPQEAGELRSHITIATLPPRDSGTTPESAAAGPQPGQLRFQINALLGLSIPAIVRSGEPDVRAAIQNAHVSMAKASGPNAPPSAVMTLDLVRLGASSLYGNVEVHGRGDILGVPPIGLARGVGVYTEIDRRTIQIVLSRAPAPGEHLEVTFTDDDTSPGKLLAKLDL